MKLNYLFSEPLREALQLQGRPFLTKSTRSYSWIIESAGSSKDIRIGGSEESVSAADTGVYKRKHNNAWSRDNLDLK